MPSIQTDGCCELDSTRRWRSCIEIAALLKRPRNELRPQFLIRQQLIEICNGAGQRVLKLSMYSRSELDRIVFESIGFFCPGFTDGFERREPIQSLETLGEVVGVEECLDVLAKLVAAVVVVAPFESTVHPLDLPVRPRILALLADAQSRAIGRANRTYGFATSQSDLNGSLADHRTGCRCR